MNLGTSRSAIIVTLLRSVMSYSEPSSHSHFRDGDTEAEQAHIRMAENTLLNFML